MKDNRKTKLQLIQELEELRSLNSVLESRLVSLSDKSISDTEFPLIEQHYSKNLLLNKSQTITQDRFEQDVLQESLQRYQNLVESSTDWIWEIDLQGNHTFTNSAVKTLLGYEVNEILGESAFPLMHTDDLEAMKSMITESIEKKSGWSNVEIRWLHKDSSVRVFESSAKPLLDSNGEVSGFTGIDRDITEHKEAEKALLKSEFDLRTLFNAMTDIVFEMDYEGRYINIAPTSPELMFEPAEYMVGKTLHQVFPKAEADQFLSFIQQSIDSNETVTIEYPMVIGGRTVWFGGRAIPKTENTALYIATDITLQKQSHVEHERLMMAIEQSSETVVITDTAGSIEYVNPAFERITGYSRREVIGQNPRILQSGSHDSSFYIDMWKILTDGKNWSGRLINRKKDGSVYTEEATISPVQGSSGEIVNYVAVTRDITVEVKLEEQLRQAQKMEAIGQLAGGVAHDFNNLLQVINGYSELALAEIDVSLAAHEFIEEVKKAGSRGQTLVSQLLSFSRRQIINPVDLDLNKVIEKLMKMIRRVIGEHIRCEFLPGSELGTIHADYGQMEQVLMNLCVNSRDSFSAGGRIVIETGNVLIDAEYVGTHSWAKPGRYVLLSVTDNGCGMDKKTLNSVFDPFFTTKSIGKGTGLGLSTVYGIVKQHNGIIQAYSEPGKGSLFKIYLPIVERRATEIPGKVPGKARGGRETILLAEDDEMVRNLTRQILINSGYSVLEARDGDEALKIFYKHADTIDLLMMDVVMPELGGKEVYDKVRETYPEIRAIFCSGYSQNAIHTGFVLDDNLHFIQKPYSPDALLRIIRKLLDT